MTHHTSRRWLALGALSVAMLTIGLDVTVLTVALPTLAVDLHANTGALQWFSSAYTLALAAVMLPAGALGDRFGRKKMLLGALTLFALASVACALAADAAQLIAARAVLGVGAAFMMPLSMSVLPVLFPDAAERAKALTIWVTATAIGLPLGPIVGGWLLGHFWWGAVFLVNLPLVAAGGIAVALLVPESRSSIAAPLDLVGVLLSAFGMTGVTYGFIRAGEVGWSDVVAWAAIGSGLALVAAFVVAQRRSSHPLVALTLFTRNGFRWGAIFSVLVNFGMMGLFFTVPQYYQAVLGVDALGSGLRLLPLIGGLVVGTRIGAALLPGAGARVVVTAGFATLAVGLTLGAFTSVGTPYGFTALWTGIVGAGMGMAMPVVMSVAIDDLDVENSGSGSGLLQALRQAGGTIGVALLGTVLATEYRAELGPLNVHPIDDGVIAGVAVARQSGDAVMLDHVQSAFVSGMAVMLWACAAICAVGAVIATRVLPPRAEISRRAGASAADAQQSVHVG